MSGLRSGWLALFVFVWIVGAFLGSTFDYQSTYAAAGMSYSVGTANFTPGSAVVTGAGTSWSHALMAGGIIKCDDDGVWYKIQLVNSTTNLTLTSVYANAGGGGKAYTMRASPGWAGTGSGGYAQSPISRLQYLMNVSNAVQRISLLGAIPFPVPNGEYFSTAFKVVTWQWSFMEGYAMFYWIFCAPFAIMGVLCMLALIYGLISGNVTWG